MGVCTYCGKEAGFGKDRHRECIAAHANDPVAPPQLSVPAPPSPHSERELLLLELAPTIQRSVYRAIMFAFLTIFGISVALGIVAAIIRAMLG